MPYIFIAIQSKGGPGSGNWGHRGIPGKVGGSSPRGVATSYSQISESKRTLSSIKGPLAYEISMVYPDGHPDYAIASDKDLVAFRLKLDSSLGDAGIRHIKGIAEALPANHLDTISSISQHTLDVVGGAGAYSISIKSIQLAVSDNGLTKYWTGNTVEHEIGHAVELSRPAILNDVSQLYDGMVKSGVEVGLGFPTKYSTKNFHELFAESYHLFISNPIKLKQASPDMYDIMVGVFTS